MPKDFDIARVDGSVTEEELEQAQASPAGDFPLVDEQDVVDDDADPARLLTAVKPATPQEAVLNARGLRDHHTYVGVGRCLATVRGPIFHVPAFWPTAEDAAQHGAPIHHVQALVDIPRGAVIGYTNSHVGHVSLGLGGGFTSTTDYHEPGYEGVATIANTAQWCGATDVFWYETLNGYDVWPDPRKPRRKPKPLSLAERIKIVRHDYQRAKANGHEHHAARLKLWIEQMERREAKQ